MGTDPGRRTRPEMTAAQPLRGEVWDLNLDPDTRSALVLSEDIFNEGPAGLIVIAPITDAQRKIRWHVPVSPPESGLESESFIQCQDVRSVSRKRLERPRGRIAAATMRLVEDRLRILLSL